MHYHYHRLHLWLFRFNPFGVGTLGTHFPQVAPVAIISLRSLLRFIFNPFRVEALIYALPQVALKLLSRVASYCVSYSTLSGLRL
jgi:hypothetical protein